jgi:hypothetical protein
VFGEALRLGEDLADEVEAKVSAYGRWLLEAVFANDAAAALDARTKNPVWQELVRRAGGPTLRVSKRMLFVAVQLAAYDKRITDQTWRGLDPGRKEILLPLAEDRRLRDAAQHVSKFNLTQTKTRAYVGELLAEHGEAPVIRLTAPLLMGRMKKIRESLGGAAVPRARARSSSPDPRGPKASSCRWWAGHSVVRRPAATSERISSRFLTPGASTTCSVPSTR